MKELLNHTLSFPHRKSLLRETFFLSAYTLFVLFVFQPFGTYEYAHPHKIVQLSGYLLISLCYPFVKKGIIRFKNVDNSYSIKQDLVVISSALLVITFLGFFYHELVINGALQFSHLPVFLLFGLAFWFLPLSAMVCYNWLSIQKNTSTEPTPHQRDKLEITGTNLREQLFFNPTDIFYLKSNGNYVMIYFQKDGGLKHEMIRNTFNQVSGQLENSDFTTIHRSFMANVKKFDKIIREDGKHILVSRKFDIRLPVSRNKVGVIEKRLKDHS